VPGDLLKAADVTALSINNATQQETNMELKMETEKFTLDPAIREQFKIRSNWRGALSLARDWSLLVLAFAISILWPNPLSFVVAVLLLSAVHIGLAVLSHEAAHRSLFANAKLNDWVGQYLCALPNFNNMPMYRSYHMTHHRNAGTKNDPDLVMVQAYPITKARLRRRLLRDLSGQSGIKFLIGAVGMSSGYWKFQQTGVVERIQYAAPMTFWSYLRIFVRNGGAISVLWQFAIWGALYAMGHGWLYLLWVAAYCIPFPFFMRIRLLADHAVVQDQYSTNPLDHARSTQANWLEKLLLVPHNEHYHLEHHLMPSAPHWYLPKLHAILVEQGVIPPANQASGMVDVLRRVTV
jgi:fatty acid desaturase